MKNYIVAVLVVVLTLSGCVNKKENPETKTKQQNVDKIATENIDHGKLNIIEDMKSWKHPVKDIFECKNLTIKKVEVAEDKSYYVFNLESLDESYLANRKFLISIAEQIGYNDFKIASEEHFTDVKCDKIQEVVKNATTDFSKVEFIEKKKDESKTTKDKTEENSDEKKSNTNLSLKQKQAIELAEKFAKKNLREIGYEEGITNMSVNSEDEDEIVLKVWNKGSTTSETIDWLIVNLKSCKVTSENVNN